MAVKFSVCVPAYNRSNVLQPLLESILSQSYQDYEIVICEDGSPERERIRQIVQANEARVPGVIRYFENETTLGYDGNLRNLVSKASGDYCFFMGNDDLMAPNALSTVALGISRHENIGVVLRTYAAFTGDPTQVDQVFRYFESERVFPAGADTITTFYRRCVVIPGLVIHREAALEFSTERFDGTLLYQLHLVANILAKMNGLFLPEILAYYRNGGTPDFGNSEKEKGRFVPKAQTPESSLHFIQGLLDIAKDAEAQHHLPILDPILKDLGNYSYPYLAIQSRQPLPVFVGYVFQLLGKGFWSNGMFYVYFLLLVALGVDNVDRLIRVIKARLGYTPRISRVYGGGAH